MSNINERAMLVRLSVTQWTARKHDKRASAEVAENHHSDIEMGRFNKALVEKGALAPVVKAAGELRTYHYANTLPWLDEGARILPAANYNDYMSGMRSRKRDFEEAVDAFLREYDAHMENARYRLNGLFNEADYPSRDAIADKFSCEIVPDAMPAASDFRCTLDDVETDKIRQQIERRTNEAVKAAHADLWQRCHDVVAAMVERLNAYTGERSGSFRDSLVGNIREMVELLPKLNVTGDATLEAFRQRIERELAAYEPQALRNDATLRASVASEAAAILDAMTGYTS